MNEIIAYILSIMPAITALLSAIFMALVYISKIKNLVSDNERQNKELRKQIEADRADRIALQRENAELKASMKKTLNRIVNKVETNGKGK